MMGKYKKNKIFLSKNKPKKLAHSHNFSYDSQSIQENSKKLKKILLKLRSKFKCTLLTFFNSKKLII